MDQAWVDISDLEERWRFVIASTAFDIEDLSHPPAVGIGIDELWVFPDDHHVSRYRAEKGRLGPVCLDHSVVDAHALTFLVLLFYLRFAWMGMDVADRCRADAEECVDGFR